MHFLKLNFRVLFIISLNIYTAFAGYVGSNGNTFEEFNSIYEFVNLNIGNCPQNIKLVIEIKEDNFSRFNGEKNQIIMAKDPQDKDFKMILAHETSHICLFNKTNGASNMEKFRFIDEGLADIIGGRYIGGEKSYKKKVIQTAYQRYSKKRISFKEIQQWHQFFGISPHVNYDAYRVGASFVYFLTENYGKQKFNDFLTELGKTHSLNNAIQKVYKIDTGIEDLWRNYINHAYVNSTL